MFWDNEFENHFHQLLGKAQMPIGEGQLSSLYGTLT